MNVDFVFFMSFIIMAGVFKNMCIFDVPELGGTKNFAAFCGVISGAREIKG